MSFKNETTGVTRKDLTVLCTKSLVNVGNRIEL